MKLDEIEYNRRGNVYHLTDYDANKTYYITDTPHSDEVFNKIHERFLKLRNKLTEQNTSIDLLKGDLITIGCIYRAVDDDVENLLKDKVYPSGYVITLNTEDSPPIYFDEEEHKVSIKLINKFFKKVKKIFRKEYIRIQNEISEKEAQTRPFPESIRKT